MSNPRKELIATGEIYHVFNRSIANEELFANKRYFGHALDLIGFYRFSQKIRFSQYRNLSLEAKQYYRKINKNTSPIIEIYAFAFMPNHFHFLLKQTSEDGIRMFVSNFQNGYAKYYNLRIGRVGGLFNSPFKSKRISTEEQLTHVSRYIHLNPVTSYLIKPEELASNPFTSFPAYTESRADGLVKTEPILKIFGSSQEYTYFVYNQVDYQRSLQEIKNLLSDE